MVKPIPIGRNDLLEVRLTTKGRTASVHFNVLAPDNLRGWRRTTQGFSLDAAIIPNLFQEIQQLLAKE